MVMNKNNVVEKTGKLSRYLRLAIFGGLVGVGVGALLGWFAGSIGVGAIVDFVVGFFVGELLWAARE